ncbi:hypothetical protein BKA93DRAFT_820694 [Sparassis latifolia]
MDSDDERIVAEEDQMKQNDCYHPRYTPRQQLSLRLYDIEEANGKWAEWESRLIGQQRGELLDDESEDNYSDFYKTYRLRRLVDSLRGFHTGQLDLSGRSQPRYHSLMKRLSQFLADLHSVAAHVTVVEEQGERRTVVSSPEVLKNFRKKWKLAVCVDVDNLVMYTNDLQEFFEKYPEPIFQKISLFSLPPEVIHMSLSHMDVDDARNFGATCHVLRDMSRSYRYQRRNIVFPFLDSSQQVKLGDGQLKETLLNDVSFLFSRPDIIRSIRQLNIGNRWPQELLRKLGLEHGTVPNAIFYTPIWNAIEKVLSCGALGITILNLEGIALSRDMIRAMTRLSSLQTLTLEDCRLVPDVHHDWMQVARPVLNPLTNVTIFLGDTPDPDRIRVLELIALLPRVRTLFLVGPPFILPEDAFFGGLNTFATVERLVVQSLIPMHVPLLSMWMSGEPRMGLDPLRLTHFKIGALWMNRDDVLQMIDRLRTAPLQTLALEGLRSVDRELFHRLAGAFSGLRSLTLVYRDSVRQWENRAAVWPGTTWEYAPLLAGFPNLRYFGWNFRLNSLWTGTTHYLERMEAGYPEDPDDLDGMRLDYSDCELWQCLPRLFLAYCPQLEHLAFLSQSLPQTCFDIDRDKGSIRITPWTQIISLCDEPILEKLALANPDASQLMRAEKQWYFDTKGAH